MAAHSDVINRAVVDIGKLEQSNRDLARSLAPMLPESLTIGPDWNETSLLLPVQEKEINGAVAGVDSGFVDKPLFGFSLLLVRAVGVVFAFKDSKVVESHYYPNFFSFPVPVLNTQALDTMELAASNGLTRLVEELETGIALIEKFHPDFLLLDGSLLPQYTTTVPPSAPHHAIFVRVLQKVQQLFETAETSGCELVGCVEDSRATRFRSLLMEQLQKKNQAIPAGLDHIMDAVLLDHLLSHRMRTASFSYTGEPLDHPILSSFAKKWQGRVQCLYLRPAVLDRPLRIEFLAEPKNVASKAEKISPAIMALAGNHREYAFPSVLIEADLRARLRPEEIDIIYNKIVDKLGKRLSRGLRRNSRPF